MTTWYFKLQSSIEGPVNTDDLSRLAEEGIIQPDTPVREGTAGLWRPAHRVSGLFGETNRGFQDGAAALFSTNHPYVLIAVCAVTPLVIGAVYAHQKSQTMMLQGSFWRDLLIGACAVGVFTLPVMLCQIGYLVSKHSNQGRTIARWGGVVLIILAADLLGAVVLMGLSTIGAPEGTRYANTGVDACFVCKSRAATKTITYEHGKTIGVCGQCTPPGAVSPYAEQPKLEGLVTNDSGEPTYSNSFRLFGVAIVCLFANVLAGFAINAVFGSFRSWKLDVETCSTAALLVASFVLSTTTLFFGFYAI